MLETRIVLCAVDPPLHDAWCAAFEEVSGVEVVLGDILSREADAIVSPANSFGFMDGGLDLVYSRHFGWALEDRVRAVIEAEHDGELPVGQAIMVETEHTRVPWLILAPTMRVPMRVDRTVHAYLAFRAVLRLLRAHGDGGAAPIRSVLCPGLGTGEGRMPPERCAHQMRHAYDVCTGAVTRKGGLAGAAREHMALIGESD